MFKSVNHNLFVNGILCSLQIVWKAAVNLAAAINCYAAAFRYVLSSAFAQFRTISSFSSHSESKEMTQGRLECLKEEPRIVKV